MSTQTIPFGDELAPYIAMVRRYPILDREAERQLAVRWRDRGDTRAAHTLITSNLRFVVKIALQFRGYRVPLLDLVQEGNVGLMRAVEKFDPSRDTRLITYAAHWIRAEILSYLMRTTRSMRLSSSRAHRKLFFKINPLKATLASRGIDEHDRVIDRIAELTGVPREVVEQMDQTLSGRELSIDASGDGTEVALGERLSDNAPSPEERLATYELESDQERHLTQALTRLTSRERAIIEQRYLTEAPRHLKDIGDGIGVSKQRAFQLEQRALKKLRRAFAEAA